jgi:hypothetical protein
VSESNGKQVMVQGRIVWVSGDLFKGKLQTDMHTNAPRLNKAGEQMRQYGFGLAVPKSVLGQTGKGEPGEIWAAIHEEAFTLFPSRQLPPAFAMKYKDGDGIDDKGAPFSSREGYAGHLVFACTTSLPIKFFKWENGQNILINEGIKCGDYVNVQLSIKAHPAAGQAKAGLYLNPNAVQFLGFGKEIINTPSGDQIFGIQAPPQMGSATPIAPPGMLVPQGQPPSYAAPVSNYAPPAAAPVQPHYGVLPQAHQPAQAPMNNYAPPAMPQMPVQPQQNAGFPAYPPQR